jgi:cardiolipin synthase
MNTIKKYFDECKIKKGSDKINMSLFHSSPSFDKTDISKLIISAIAMADSEITIVTPYFFLMDELIDALTNAAHNNIKIKIIIPNKNDTHP